MHSVHFVLLFLRWFGLLRFTRVTRDDSASMVSDMSNLDVESQIRGDDVADLRELEDADVDDDENRHCDAPEPDQ